MAALGDPRFKIEMPAAQLEIVTAPHATVADAAAELADARRTLAARRFRVAGAGVHPFASGLGPLNPGARYEAIGTEYASVANRQLVFGLHIHIAIPGADRALATYNALRPTCPTSLRWPPTRRTTRGRTADWRPSARGSAACCRARGSLPRSRASTCMRMPCAGAVSTTRASGGGSCACTRSRHGRDPRAGHAGDDRGHGGAVATVAYELATRLEPAPPAESWKLDQNRWAACRHGLDAEMTDPHTGERATARERLTRVLGAAPPELDGARRQRDIAAERGLRGLVETLAEAFVSPARGPG